MSRTELAEDVWLAMVADAIEAAEAPGLRLFSREGRLSFLEGPGSYPPPQLLLRRGSGWQPLAQTCPLHSLPPPATGQQSEY
jgi:hypothetical protein